MARWTAKEIKKDIDKVKDRKSEMREEDPTQAFRKIDHLQIGKKWK